MEQNRRFENLTYEHFRRMAGDQSLSRYEKIGFPNSYRQGKEAAIWSDILAKLPALSDSNKVVLDVGPGCSELPSMLIDLCRDNGHTLLLVDSPEMLAHLPAHEFLRKYPGFYPECPDLIAEYRGRVDVMLCYSVFHYIFAEADVGSFLDVSLSLLSDGGQLLIGDIPNESKRDRFFGSPAGIAFHRAFTGQPDSIPKPRSKGMKAGLIDDSVVMGIVHRARSASFDAYILPQGADLPMANRREDILIRKP